MDFNPLSCDLYQKEEHLKRLLGLDFVNIVPSCENVESTLNTIGAAGAIRMKYLLTPDDILGTSWGGTIDHVARNLIPVKQRDKKQIEVVQLLGGVPVNSEHYSTETVKLITDNLDAIGYMLNTPGMVDTVEAKEAIFEDGSVLQILDKATGCTKSMLGIGSVPLTSEMYKIGFISEEEMDELRKGRAVGEILGRFYDIEGVPVLTSFGNRVIGCTLDDISKMGSKIAFCIGDNKIRAIYGACRGGYINELVTDEQTADGLFEYIAGRNLLADVVISCDW